MIKIKINTDKIDEARLFQGAKGKYLDAVLIETPNSDYGDYMIVQEVTKEERQAGVKGPILGNGSIIGQPKQAPKPAEPPASLNMDDESVPF